MDVNYINPFLQGTLNVLKQMAFITAVPGKPFVKESTTAAGDVSGIIGITGDATGSLAISFTEPCICEIVNSMLGEHHTSINAEIIDAVGEITNMISGVARNFMEKEGIKAFAAIPTVVYGKNHTINAIYNIPSIILPFSTPAGPFFVDVCIKTTPGEERKTEDYQVRNIRTSVDPSPRASAEERRKQSNEPAVKDRGAVLRDKLTQSKSLRNQIEEELSKNPFMELAKRKVLKTRMLQLDAAIKSLKLDISAWEMLSRIYPEEKNDRQKSIPSQDPALKEK